VLRNVYCVHHMAHDLVNLPLLLVGIIKQNTRDLYLCLLMMA
jgi:hypothetical protein